MSEPGCPYGRCDGTGWVVRDSFNAEMCLCLKRKQVKAALGQEIWDYGSRVRVDTSPLYKPGGVGNPPEIDRTRDNLFIRGTYSTLLAHLRRGLGGKLLDTGCNFHLQIVTDERLKNVFVGNESSKLLKKERREYNESVGDLIGVEHDLVVIRLGHLGHTNKAAPGLLKESLLLRAGLGKPTWVCENTDIPFRGAYMDSPAYPAWSLDVVDYMEQRYETIDLDVIPAPVQEALDPEDISPDEAPEPEPPPRRFARKDTSEPAVPGFGGPKQDTFIPGFGGPPKGKKKGGSGPFGGCS